MQVYKLKNRIMSYPWGSIDHIPDMLGMEPTGEPQAELWMGAHPKAPSEIDLNGRLIRLDKFLMDKKRLKFLFKILSVDDALSIQAHPDRDQAEQGYLDEEKAGLSRRTYTDMNAKPEMFFTLSLFWALIGFRPSDEIIKNIETYCRNTLSDEIEAFRSDSDIKKLFRAILFSGKDAVSEAVAKALVIEDTLSGWILALHESYPGDKGVLAPLYMSLIKFAPGTAVFLPAGVLHAYLKGNILELMGNSDNVVRGGLTKKYINRKELLRILSLRRHRNIKGIRIDGGIRYSADGLVLDKLKIDGKIDRRSGSYEIILCTDGCIECDGMIIEQGESAFVMPGGRYCLNGKAEIFVAMHE